MVFGGVSRALSILRGLVIYLKVVLMHGGLAETPGTPKIPIYSHFLFYFVIFLGGLDVGTPKPPQTTLKQPQIPLSTPISPNFLVLLVRGFVDPAPHTPFLGRIGGG